jgi:CTP:molybdopterin cytidylyltransferase MocA
VVINGRSQAAVESAVRAVESDSAAEVLGVAADISTVAERARARRIYNILGDRVATVAPWFSGDSSRPVSSQDTFSKR